jgi:calmodulin-binding transcription activator
MAYNTNIYSGNQDNSPVVFNGSSPLFTMNGRASQTDLPSWNEVTSGPVQMPPAQFPVLPEQGTSVEGLGADYLTFDEVYSDGLNLNDVSATGADGESFWQVCPIVVSYGVTYNIRIYNHIHGLFPSSCAEII